MRSLLHRELNAQPSEETTALIHAIRSGPRQVLPPATMGEARGLPHPITSLIGREAETEEVLALLRDARLVTLVGSGGVGKSRLAVEIAHRIAPTFANGAVFVELAALNDTQLVPEAVARALGAREEPERPLAETLAHYLRPRSLLLVVDNAEHLVEAAAGLVTNLLRECAGLRVLVTSRQPLGLTGEVTWRVPSLEVPEALPTDHPDEGADSDAVRLFIERARQAQPGFHVEPGAIGVIGHICRRLDGIPLAIELAAARVRVLPVDQIAGRLDDCFRLLTGGSRTALTRHQTLRATMDWSYDLLGEQERSLLRRLSVFAGGWELTQAEAVSGQQIRGGADILDQLTLLVDRSGLDCATASQPG